MTNSIVCNLEKNREMKSDTFVIKFIKKLVKSQYYGVQMGIGNITCWASINTHLYPVAFIKMLPSFKSRNQKAV